MVKVGLGKNNLLFYIMSQTRVIYTDSTSAECSNVLKAFNFEENSQEGAFVNQDNPAIKAYLVWGKIEYYPEFHQKLTFSPRVQVHFKSKEDVSDLNLFIKETVLALRNLDSNSQIQVFDANSKTEFF